jgi:hypothetical protein
LEERALIEDRQVETLKLSQVHAVESEESDWEHDNGVEVMDARESSSDESDTCTVVMANNATLAPNRVIANETLLPRVGFPASAIYRRLAYQRSAEGLGVFAPPRTIYSRRAFSHRDA